MADEGDPSRIHASLKRSGLPFQTAVAMTLAKAPGWELRGTEVPWLDPAGADRFLDVLGRSEDLFAVVECKKMDDAELIFLRPTGSGLRAQDGSVNLACTIRDYQKPSFATFCATFRLRNVEALTHQLCIVAGRNRPLEEDLAPLVHATNWIASQHRDFLLAALRGPRGDDSVPAHVMYLPLLVTNAPLFSTEYHPGRISLETASFGEMPKATPVPWAVMTKAFAVGDFLASAERSVVVVRANAMNEFLTTMHVEARPELQDPPKRPAKPAAWKYGI